MKKEKSHLTQPAQRRYKKQRRKNDIYTTMGGHKNPNSGSPYKVKIKRFGTDPLRFEEIDNNKLFKDKGEIQMRLTESALRKLVVSEIKKVLSEQAGETEVRGGEGEARTASRELLSRFVQALTAKGMDLSGGFRAKAMVARGPRAGIVRFEVLEGPGSGGTVSIRGVEGESYDVGDTFIFARN